MSDRTIELEMRQGPVGMRGKIVLGGTDVSRFVSAVSYRGDVDEPSEVVLTLPAVELLSRFELDPATIRFVAGDETYRLERTTS